MEAKGRVNIKEEKEERQERREIEENIEGISTYGKKEREQYEIRT